MKVLEQARPNLPQKPAKSSKQAVKDTAKLRTVSAVDDDDDVSSAAAATSSKPSGAASSKAASKTSKPNSATASAAGKKVQFSVYLGFMFCRALLHWLTHILLMSLSRGCASVNVFVLC